MKYFGIDRRNAERSEDSGRDSSDRRSLDSRRTSERRDGEGVDELRRQSERRDTDRRDSERRQGQRRQEQRREFYRVIYPPDVAPKILNTNYHIIDISCKGIRFYCEDKNGECKPPVKISQPLKLTIEFQDTQTLEVNGKILRCYVDEDLGAKVYCALLTDGVDIKRINDEQRYLLKHFPDFYRPTDLGTPDK